MSNDIKRINKCQFSELIGKLFYLIAQRDLEELRGKLKPPDRGKFDRELAKINTAIRDLEAKFVSNNLLIT